jgi:hypothetical protein
VPDAERSARPRGGGNKSEKSEKSEKSSGRAGADAGGRRAVRGTTTTDRVLIAAAIAMLIVWTVWTFVINDAPGWVHLFLTVGVFLLIWRIVAVGTPDPKD